MLVFCLCRSSCAGRARHSWNPESGYIISGSAEVLRLSCSFLVYADEAVLFVQGRHCSQFANVDRGRCYSAAAKLDFGHSFFQSVVAPIRFIMNLYCHEFHKAPKWSSRHPWVRAPTRSCRQSTALPHAMKDGVATDLCP